MKVALAFGTRPEAIKMAPVIAALREHPGVTTEIVLTAQHRELLDRCWRCSGCAPTTI